MDLDGDSSYQYDSSSSGDYPPPPPLDPGFALGLSIARVATWWLMLLAMVGVAYFYRRSRSTGWLLYRILFSVLVAICLENSIYLAYADAIANERPGVKILYNCYIFFANLASSSFLGLLLLLASGYNITRTNLGPHTEKVIFIPSILLVSGLITEYIIYNIRDGDDDKIHVERLSTWEMMLWFVCSLINLAALLLAWVYIFDALQHETEGLEAAQQVRRGVVTGVPMLDAHAAAENGQLEGDPGTLPHDMDPRYKHLGGERADPAALEGEEGGLLDREDETVEDRLSYEKKKRLLSRFGIGVSLYLVAEISVLLLPIFVIDKVQNAILAGSFITQVLFMAALIFIFRPVAENPYLMLGHSAEDAEHLGLVDLTTELAMLEEDSPRIVPDSTGALDTRARDQGRENGAASPPLSPLPHSTRLPVPGKAAAREAGGPGGPGAARGEPKLPVSLPPKGLTVRTQPLPREGPEAQFSLGDEEEDDTLHEIHLRTPQDTQPRGAQ